MDKTYTNPEEGISAVRKCAIAIMESVPALDKLKNQAWYDMEDKLTAIIDSHAEDIFQMRLREHNYEDIDNYLRGVFDIEEDIDEHGNNVLLDEKWIAAIHSEMDSVFDAELGTWDNIGNAYDSLRRKNPEFSAWCSKMVASHEEE